MKKSIEFFIQKRAIGLSLKKKVDIRKSLINLGSTENVINKVFKFEMGLGNYFNQQIENKWEVQELSKSFK